MLAIDKDLAAHAVVANHYLHRRPPLSYAFGLYDPDLVGVVTYGCPASRDLQRSVCPTDPDLVLELNRLWVDDRMERNSESWFVARTLPMLPPRLVVSYADTRHGHIGYIYRALNFHYAGWTDMDKRKPRFDYVFAADPGRHSRAMEAHGYTHTLVRAPKVRYWTTSGGKRDRRRLERLCGWPTLDWKTTPPPQLETLPEPELRQVRQSKTPTLEALWSVDEPAI